MASRLNCDDALAVELVAACESGERDIVSSFLDRGGDPSTRVSFPWDRDNPPPLLWFALQHGHPDIAMLMLERGADVDYRDVAGRNLLPWGLISAGVMKHLLARGLNFADAATQSGEQLLYQAARQSNCTAEVVSMLLDAGADIKSGLVEPFTGRLLCQPIHAAALFGRFDLVSCFISRGVDPDVRSARGLGPVDYLAGNVFANEDDAEAVFGSLLALGVDMNRLNGQGRAPLHSAARLGREQNCRVLLRLGAHIDVRARSNETPLVLAAEEGHAAVCELLLDHGADPDASTAVGRPARSLAGFPGNRRDHAV